MKFKALLLISLIIVLASCSPKIGYVNKTILLSETNISKQAQADIQSKANEYQIEIKKQEDEMLALKRLVEKTENLDTISQELNKKIKRIKEFREDHFSEPE